MKLSIIMDEKFLCLKWNNHSTAFFNSLFVLRKKEVYNDVTLACDGKFYPVHKIVLSVCSDYFEQILSKTSCKHPVIVLKDIEAEDLEILLNFMYVGEVNVLQEKLHSVIKAAECLKIKGLAIPDSPSDGCSLDKKCSNKRTLPRSSENLQPGSSQESPGFFRNNPNDSFNVSEPPRKVYRALSDSFCKISDTGGSRQQTKDFNRAPICKDLNNAEFGSKVTESCIKAEPQDMYSSPDDVIVPKQEFTDSGDDPVIEEQDQQPFDDLYSNVSWEESSQVPYLSDYTGGGDQGQSSQQDNLLEDKTQQSSFSCQFCAYWTINRSNFKRHMVTHTGERRFQCNFCPYRANQSNNLVRHIKVLHSS